MKILGNIIWVLFGGFFVALEYFVSSIGLFITIIGIPFGIFIGGIWIFLSHLLFGVIFCITIIGIPFGMQHFKLARLAITPFGHDVL